MNRAFFIDKDGTIVDNSNYPNIIPTDDILESEVLRGLRYIQAKGYFLIMLSNQPWVAKGKMKKVQVDNIFKNIINKLRMHGIKISDYFYCPHKSSDNCECKKPKPKMVYEATKKYNLDLKNSFIIGDMEADIETGKNSGMRTILVLTGNGKKYKDFTKADYIIENLNEVNTII